ncbi:S1 RNA-binding domain-containing protein [Mycoplasma marinum]|uniref:S1 RNA-binding domain-containing protein n=1 Tax=Mycoplasma marinum TaxID=1937190 RepID=UPI0014446A81|nr:S1 RNA-binding domain-containing protein [Mycoplasma marinum]
MYKVKDIVIGEVIYVGKAHFIVALKNEWRGLVHITEISDYYVSNIKYFVEKGDKIPLKVIGVNEEEKRIKLSYKSIMPRFQKDPFNYTLESTRGGFDGLTAMLNERLKYD